MAESLSSWLAEQEDWGSISGSPLEFSEIGYLLLPSLDMAEIPLKLRQSSIQHPAKIVPSDARISNSGNDDKCRND